MRSATELCLMKLLANALFQKAFAWDDGEDYEKLSQEAFVQGVPALVLRQLKNSDADPALIGRYRQAVTGTIIRSAYIEQAHGKLHQLLTEAGIPYVILKGCASARYYPVPGNRALGDVDFLVKHEDLARTEQLLLEAGFVKGEADHPCHEVFDKNGVRLELHREPSGIPEGEAGRLARAYLSDAVELAQPYETSSGMILVPTDFHHGLILLLHTAHHLIGEGIGLRQLCDWAVFAAGIPDKVFCALFEDKLKAVGLWRLAQILTQLATQYLGCPAKSWSGVEAPELVESLLEDIFSGGNLGQKDRNRNKQALLLSARDKNEQGKHSAVGQLFSSMNAEVRAEWPASKKAPLLLPAGWAYLAGRYFWRVACGKRSLFGAKKTFQEAAQRRSLYGKLQLFEEDKVETL